MTEPDPQLRRLQRGAAATWAVITGAAAATGDGRAVAGAVGGGMIVLVSYAALRSGVDGAIRGVASGASGRTVSTWRLVKYITRFAILGAIAYVMMVRLRAQPGWMLAGASSLVAAAALEAVRATRARR